MNPSSTSVKSYSFPTINKKTVLKETKWLKLVQIDYTDQENHKRKWDSAERTGVGKSGIAAVVIIPIIRRKSGTSIVLVEQFRPPLGCNILELPAGLVDGDEDPKTAAIRELKEETGYTATEKEIIHNSSSALASDPGITSSSCLVYTFLVDGDNELNKNPVQELDEGEHIILHEIPIKGLLNWLEKKSIRDCSNPKHSDMLVDRALYCFACGLDLTNSLL